MIKSIIFPSILLAICQMYPNVHGYNILFFVPGLSNSHVMFDARFANMLAKDNRNKVTFLVEEINSDCKRAQLLPEVKQIWSSSPKVMEMYKGLSANSRNIFEKEESERFLEIQTHFIHIHAKEKYQLTMKI